MAERLVLAAGVAAGVTNRGFGFVTPAREIELELPVVDDGPVDLTRRIDALRRLATGDQAAAAWVGRLSTDAPDAGARAVTQLREAGVLVPVAVTAAAHRYGAPSPLSTAIVAASKPRTVATAEEALVFALDADARERTAIVRAFVAAISPPLKLELYAVTAMTGVPTVLGDAPDAAARDLLQRRLPELDPRRTHVLRFADGALESYDAGEVLAPATTPGRLRIVTRLSDDHDVTGVTATAVYACPDLRFAAARLHRRAYGTAPSRALAREIAATEAVERFACGDLSGHRLSHAAARDLPGAVPGDHLIAFSERQYEQDPGLARFDVARPSSWARARTAGDAPRWVPAELVFTPYVDERVSTVLGYATTSGVAAAATAATARRRALFELVERDAYMWTWLQRAERARIAVASLPAPLRAAVAAVASRRREVTFVDLTLETKAVVLCAVISPTGHGIGIAAHDDPAAAAAHAFSEAAAGYEADGDPSALPAAEDVRFPLDHRRWYGAPGRREHARFLWNGPGEIGIGDVTSDDRPIVQLVETVGDPLFVTLRPPGRGPVTVVRALVPGLIPLTFGRDREPLGMARIGHPIVTAAGTEAGRRIDPAQLVDLAPHPFA